MPERPRRRRRADDPPARGGRPLWSGTLSFGLVTIPVQILSAVRHNRVTLRTLSAEGTPLGRRYACSAEGVPLRAEQIVRGYEVEPGRFVVVDDEELAAIAPEKSRDIDVRQFVDARAIDPIFFDRPYFLVPSEGSSKAYRLLAETMAKAERAAIATFVMRDREYLVAIASEDRLLRLQTLRFVEELRSVDDVGLPAPRAARAGDLRAIQKAMRPLYAEQVEPADLVDERDRQLLALIADKDRDNRDVVETDAEPAPGDAVVIDLMETLKRSLRANAKPKPAGKKRAA